MRERCMETGGGRARPCARRAKQRWSLAGAKPTQGTFVDRRPPRAEFQRKQGECDRPNFPSTTKTRSPRSSTSLSPPILTSPCLSPADAGATRSRRVSSSPSWSSVSFFVYKCPLQLPTRAHGCVLPAFTRCNIAFYTYSDNFVML